MTGADLALQITPNAKLTLRIADQPRATAADLRALAVVIDVIADAVERAQAHSKVRAVEARPVAVPK